MGISKKKCVEAWLDEIRPFGDVLEIGSGEPLAAIQAFLPKTYHKIDCEKEQWQQSLPQLGTFDFILYNGKVLEKAQGTGDIIVNEGKKALQRVREALPAICQMRYSDKDLDAFGSQIAETQKRYLTKFLNELFENGQITDEQYERQLEKFHLKRPALQKEVSLSKDHLFECIQECLKHMRKGSRFSCMIGANSNYEDPKFFEHIIANPSFNYQERAVNDTNYMLIEVL